MVILCLSMKVLIIQCTLKSIIKEIQSLNQNPTLTTACPQPTQTPQNTSQTQIVSNLQLQIPFPNQSLSLCQLSELLPITSSGDLRELPNYKKSEREPGALE